MNNNNSVRFKHHKPPYEYAPKFRCVSVCEPDLPPCPAPQISDLCTHECNCAPEQPVAPGLLQYRNWWERIEVDLAVNGDHITGVPIFVKDNTLRVINDDYSYFIPLIKIDYIRTGDGLRSSFQT